MERERLKSSYSNENQFGTDGSADSNQRSSVTPPLDPIASSSSSSMNSVSPQSFPSAQIRSNPVTSINPRLIVLIHHAWLKRDTTIIVFLLN